ncbi:SWIM zinc finger domain-containing protein [Bacteroidota bacterium]
MNRRGEYLFDTAAPDLESCIENLTDPEIRSSCEYKVFIRGQEYLLDGAVEKVDYNKKENLITSRVSGTLDYSVSIHIEEGAVYGSCDCPYDDVCKHIAATLLWLKKEGLASHAMPDIQQANEDRPAESLKKHLDSLSKTELVELVMKFAPDNFITSIHNRTSTSENAGKILGRIDKKLNDLFNDEELLWDPYGFEGALMTQLDKLRGLERKLTDEIGELLIFIMLQVETVMDEGYLYIDRYPDEEYFEGDAFCSFTKDFLRTLPLDQRLEYLLKLDTVLKNLTYDTFSYILHPIDSLFTKEEYPGVKNFIMNQEGSVPDTLLASLYSYLETGLSDDEKEKILLRLSEFDNEFSVGLCRLQIGRKCYRDALKTISIPIENPNGIISEEMLKIYLDLSIELNHDPLESAKKSIEINPTASMLEYIKGLGVTPLTLYEETVKEKHPAELLSFYENNKRLDDAITLIKEGRITWDSTLFDFFRKNKKFLPADAEEYFQNRIRKNLNDAGNYHYEKIAESISQLKQVNPDLAAKWLGVIRTEYKRRRNLITMLDKY